MYNYTDTDLKTFKRCMTDPIYFIENYCLVNDIRQGLIKINLTDVQKSWIKDAESERIIEMEDDRQIGKSIFIAAYALHQAMFSHDKTILIVNTKFVLLKQMQERIGLMHEMLPEKMRAIISFRNTRNIEFDNGTRISLEVASDHVGRGRAINTLFLDDFSDLDYNLQRSILESLFTCMMFADHKTFIIGKYDGISQ